MINKRKWVEFYKQEQYETAEELLIKELKKAETPSDNSYIQYNLGVINIELDKFEDAIKYLKKSVQVSSANRERYEACIYNLGFCNYKIAKFKEARHYFKLYQCMSGDSDDKVRICIDTLEKELWSYDKD